MQTPNILHPRKITINGYVFEVVSFISLTDEQAAKVATHFYRTNKLKKSDVGKTIRIVTLFDENSIGML